MSRPLGMAGDFYRARIIKLDEGDSPDLEWRDDILYRSPPASSVEEYDRWAVEAVELADDEKAFRLGVFDTKEEAYSFDESVQEGIQELTRNEFEERFFPA